MRFFPQTLRIVKPMPAILSAVLCPLAAQAADAAAPGTGAILQQIQPVMPAIPSPTGTKLTIERQDSAGLPPSAPFEVKTIRITGHTVFDTPTLHALIADGEGKSLILSQLGELAARITGYYHRHGYPLARAIIPAQAIRAGVVDIEVSEARYGKISLGNNSRVNDPLLQDTLASLQVGQVIEQEKLDHALLLLSDIPGVVIAATLKPGETVGTSDLLVNTTHGPSVTGQVVADNYGNRYTGRARIGAMLNIFNALQRGDVISVSGLGAGSGMNYGRMTYETLLNGRGTRVGGAYSALHYVLGDTLASLNAHGTAKVASLWVKHPLVRSRDLNLYGHIQHDRLQLRDHIDTGALETDRSLKNWTASLAGDSRDLFLSGAVNAWNVSWTSGHVGFDNRAAQVADAGTAKTQGSFSKWNANFARLQTLSPKNGLYLALSGQWTGDNLDASQKMTAGGPYTVRAYDMGVISGDSGYLATIELRHDLVSGWHGSWQAVAFVDSARVTVNTTPWVAGVNSATLSGAGVGINWTGPYLWSARAYIARPIGAVPVLLAGTESTRAWIEIGKRF
ncbi:MAG: ShlB/FhaC/HecB family hemolysin secretion/activation protein [Pseudomonadota bacterium]